MFLLTLHNQICLTCDELFSLRLAVYWFGITAAMTAGGYYLWSLNHKANIREEVELRSARLATAPLLQAEQDRELLKLMRRNRDYEEKLMANVEDWEVNYLKIIIV